MAQKWGGEWGCREEGVQAEVLCECRSSFSSIDHPIGCMLPKKPGLTLHWGFPESSNALSPKQVSPAPFLISQLSVFNTGLSVLWHSCLVFHSAERFNVVSPCLFTVNHIMLPTPNFPTFSHYSSSPWETVCWILASLLPWYPCVLLCHSFSFALYHFWSLSLFITSLHSDFDFYWTPPVCVPVTAA